MAAIVVRPPLLTLIACWLWASPAASQEQAAEAPPAQEGPGEGPAAEAAPTPGDDESIAAPGTTETEAPATEDAEGADAATSDNQPPDDQNPGADPAALEGSADGQEPDGTPSESGDPGAEPPSDPFSSEAAEANAVDPYVHSTPPEPAESDDPRSVSVTFSPLHAFLPAFEGTIELRVTPGLGVAGIFGVGSAAAERSDGTSERLSVIEAGGQVVWYPLGAFDRLQVGAELLYVHVSGSVDDVEGYGTGLGVGPLVGYKLLTDVGFTLFVQGGFQYLALQAEARDADGSTSQASDSAVVPLLNFNLGWSF